MPGQGQIRWIHTPLDFGQPLRKFRNASQDLVAIVLGWPKPDQNAGSTAVNVAHPRDLDGFLVRILLIDANAVDPKRAARRRSMPVHMLQCLYELGRDR